MTKELQTNITTSGGFRFCSVGGGAKRISRGHRVTKLNNLVNLSKFTNFRLGDVKFSAEGHAWTSFGGGRWAFVPLILKNSFFFGFLHIIFFPSNFAFS